MQKLAIVDDHDLFREMLINYIGQTGHFKISFATTNSYSLFKELLTNEPPDLLLLDMRLKDESGIDIIRVLREKGYTFKILAFTMFHHENVMKECISTGANGYITKNIQSDKFVQALYDIIESNEILVEDEKQEYILLEKSALLDWDTNSLNITKRELDFLRLCAQADLTYKQIADKLNVSPKTADKFRESLFKKLKVRSKTEMILYAKEQRLI